jgi:hypothetical protein
LERKTKKEGVAGITGFKPVILQHPLFGIGNRWLSGHRSLSGYSLSPIFPLLKIRRKAHVK